MVASFRFKLQLLSIVISVFQVFARPECKECTVEMGQDHCERYCDTSTYRCRADIHSVCKWNAPNNERTGIFVGCNRIDRTFNTAKSCYCRRDTIIQDPSCPTNKKISPHSEECTISYAVGPCDESHKSETCYHDCDGKCVYDYGYKVGECKKYCEPIEECPALVNPHFDHMHEHDYRNYCHLSESTCSQNCKPCQLGLGRNIKFNRWSKCKLEKGCASNTCVSTKIGTENDISPVKTYCFRYEMCPMGEECPLGNKAFCEDTTKCIPCPLKKREQFAVYSNLHGQLMSNEPKCYLDDDGECVYDFRIEGDEQKFRYARKCQKVFIDLYDGTEEWPLIDAIVVPVPDDNDDGDDDDQEPVPIRQEDPLGFTWEEAQYYCRWYFNSNLGTIRNQQDVDTVKQLIEDSGLSILSLWIGVRSAHKAGFFGFVDGTECPPEHNGRFSGVCTDPSIWAIGHPITCTAGGQMCVRLIVEDGIINNDMHCEERLEYFFCNKANSATEPWIPPFPK